MAKQPDISSYLEKVKKLERGEQLDLSSDEDLSIGIMNLISIEEHLFFTYNKTDNPQYLDLLNEVREMRKDLLKRIIKEYEGEVWCISKHLLSGAMRLMEVGTKSLSKGKRADAEELFRKSFRLYSLFWGLNLGLVKTSDAGIREADVPSMPADNGTKRRDPVRDGIFSKLGQIVKKAVDCCRE
jgi:hypothetical protein